jgi:hypothetical protein
MDSMPFWVRPWGLRPCLAHTRSSSWRSPSGIQQDSTTLPSRLEVQWRSGVDIEKACVHVHTLPEKGRHRSGMATVDRAE